MKSRQSDRHKNREHLKKTLLDFYNTETKIRVLQSFTRCQHCDKLYSDTVHHKRGRQGVIRLDRDSIKEELLLYSPQLVEIIQEHFIDSIPLLIYSGNLMAVNNVCHRYIHDNPAISYENGWMLKRI
jgi:hypothetical protein